MRELEALTGSSKLHTQTVRCLLNGKHLGRNRLREKFAFTSLPSLGDFQCPFCKVRRRRPQAASRHLRVNRPFAFYDGSLAIVATGGLRPSRFWKRLLVGAQR